MKLVVLGSGESGVGSAILAKSYDYDVFVSDYGVIGSRFKQILDDHGILWEEGKHTEEKILQASLIVKSPGIPDQVPILLKKLNLRLLLMITYPLLLQVVMEKLPLPC